MTTDQIDAILTALEVAIRRIPVLFETEIIVDRLKEDHADLERAFTEYEYRLYCEDPANHPRMQREKDRG